MPVSKRTGKRYAAGSQVKWGGWEKKTCSDCGRKLTLKMTGAYNHGPPPTSWCGPCLHIRGVAATILNIVDADRRRT
jgi:hypothetical protein